MRARLHARGGRLGFFREGTHELCDARPTRQLLPATHDALDRVRRALSSGVAAGLAGCELLENAAATERVALFEIEDLSQAPLAVDPLTESPACSLSIIRARNPPWSSDLRTSRMRSTFAGHSIQLTHHVQSFFQGNRYLLATLLERVLAQVPEGSVTDLYAGVGLFAVALAARGPATVVAVEADRSSARDLEANAEPLWSLAAGAS